MRPLLPLLLLALLARADDPFETTLKIFEDVAPNAFTPGSKSRVYPAVEAMVESADPRAVMPLVMLLVDTLTAQDRLQEEIKKAQTRAAEAYRRSQDIERELTVLRVREKAGAVDVGPKIEEREAALRREGAAFRQVREEADRFDRLIAFAKELRAKLSDGAAALLKSLGADKGGTVMPEMRRVLDISEERQSVYLALILRDSGLPSAAPHLLEILQHPKASEATRRHAISGIVPVATPAELEALLRAAEADTPPVRAHALHALGLKAQRPLATVDEARAWVGSLPR